jgi:threonylcarbamoyladenosine tRNA methylthiotransferase MtaB
MKKIYFINIGCKVNFAETSRLKKMFEELGYEIVSSQKEAEIILINTCTVTNSSDADSRKIIRRARKLNSTAFIGVLGCYAQLKPQEILDTTGADAIFGINDKFKIPEIIKQYEEKLMHRKSITHNANAFANMKNNVSNTSNTNNSNDINNINDIKFNIDNTKFDFAYSADSESRARAFLKLQDGCNFHCSYCIIPFARGSSRSIDFDMILPQINELENADYKEIVISGINLSDYFSQGRNFIDLLEFISNLDKDIRFRISSIEPHIIDEKLLEIIANSKNICPHFHIPLQSGCDEILKKMRRRYNQKQFRDIIKNINDYIPNAFIGLDVISGFPTETEENFNETKDFINELNISSLHCFTFSNRAGTLASTMKEQVPKSEKKRRTNELINLSDLKYQTFLEQNIDKVLTFLPEQMR